MVPCSRCFVFLACLAVSLLPGPADGAAAPPRRVDRHGDALPPGAFARLGTVRFRHADPVLALGFSPDGKTLLSLSTNGIRIWEAATGRQQAPFARNCRNIDGFALSPDGKTVVFVSWYGLHFWDLSTRRKTRTIENQNPIQFNNNLGLFSPPPQVAFSLDGRLLAAQGVGLDTDSIWLCDPRKGKCIRRLQGHKGKPLCLAVSPDGKVLASGCDDGTIRLWGVATGRELRTLLGHEYHVKSVVFTPDGKHLVSAGPNDGALRIWDAVTGNERRQLRPVRGKQIAAVVLSPDGQIIAAGVDREIVLWDWVSGKEFRRLRGHGGNVNCLAFSPDGRTLASGGDDHAVRMWDVATAREVRPEAGRGGAVDALAFSPDGQTLAAADSHETVRLWTAGEEKVWLAPCSPAVRHHEIAALAFASDGRLLGARYGPEPAIYRWDRKGRVEIIPCQRPDRFLVAFALSPDGQTLATGSHEHSGGSRVFAAEKTTIRVWETATGRELRRLEGHQSTVQILAVSPDGRVLASWAEEETLRLWEIVTGKEVLRIRISPESVDGRGPRLCCLEFAPDGKTIAAGTRRGDVLLWDVATGREVRRLSGHGGAVRRLAFSPDGRTLASGSADTTALFWRMEAERRHPAARRLSRADLEANWKLLCVEDDARAYRALWEMVGAPVQSLAFLKAKMTPSRPPSPGRIAALLAALADDRFMIREAAEHDLRRLAEWGEPAARRLLKDRPSPETRRRIERLFQSWRTPEGERLRDFRAVQVLETIASAEARRALRVLAGGAPEALLTREAKSALQRLGRQGRK